MKGRIFVVAAPQDTGALEEAATDLRSRGAGVVSIAADIGEPETAERAVTSTLVAFDRLDLLASNAGFAYFEKILTAPLEHFDRTMHVNARGACT